MQSPEAFQGGKQLPKVTIVPLTGVGDDAYYLAVLEQVGLIVKKGSVVFKVAVYGQLPLEKKSPGKGARPASRFRALNSYN